jgi:flagellar motor switch protein FliM
VTIAAETHEAEAARKLSGAMLEHSSFAADRLPGLAMALQQFIAEAPRTLRALFGETRRDGTIEPAQATTLFQAIGDCAGLTAAIFTNAEPPGRLMIALDERIDDLVIDAVFGENVAAGAEGPAVRPPRTAIESGLLDAFAKALGRSFDAAFAPLAPFSLKLERIVTLADTLALGRRDQPAIAARFSLPISGGACEGLVLFGQALLLPFRKELEREPEEDAPATDSRWSNRMEAEVKQTKLPVTAILEEAAMTLGDVAALRVGGVLPLQNSDFNSVRLECAGRGMFLCKLGQGDGRYRLELETPIVDPGDAAFRAAPPPSPSR